MSSHDEQRRFLADRFTQIVLGIPVKMPNTPFDIPKNAPYGEFHILGNAEPIPIGGEGSGKIRERTVGMIQLTVWVPQDAGTKIASVAGDKFGKMFKWRQFRDREGSIYRFKGLQTFTPSDKAGRSITVFRLSFEKDSIEEIQVGIS